MKTNKIEQTVVGDIAVSNTSINSDHKKKKRKKISEQFVVDKLSDLIVEQKNPNEIIAYYDTISKMLALSIQYGRLFMLDGMKLGSDALDFNYKRAKVELSRVGKLVNNMERLLEKIYTEFKQEEANPNIKNESILSEWDKDDDAAYAWSKMTDKEREEYEKNIAKINRERSIKEKKAKTIFDKKIKNLIKDKYSEYESFDIETGKGLPNDIREKYRIDKSALSLKVRRSVGL